MKKYIIIAVSALMLVSCGITNMAQHGPQKDLSLSMVLSLYNRDHNVIMNYCKTVIYYEEDEVGRFITADSLVYYIADNIDSTKSIQNRNFNYEGNAVEFCLGYNNAGSFEDRMNIRFVLDRLNLIEEVYVDNLK